LDAFSRTVADTEAILASLQGEGADERVNGLVENLIGQLKSGDSLLMPVLNGRRAAWTPAHTAVMIGSVGLRIGMELDFAHPELSLLGQAALLYEFVAGAASARPGAEEGLRLIRTLGGAFSTAGDLVFQARAQVNGNSTGNAAGPGMRVQQTTEIVAVAATYAYLAQELPDGRPTWPPLAVKEFLRRSRTRFSDAVLKALIHISVQIPVGAYVRLNTGEVAHVVAKNVGHPLRPVIVIAGRAKHPDEPQRVDLRENPLLSILEFLGHEPPGPETENRPT
jgi:hypothetical protein